MSDMKKMQTVHVRWVDEQQDCSASFDVDPDESQLVVMHNSKRYVGVVISNKGCEITVADIKR
jgi:hypothetical protein